MKRGNIVICVVNKDYGKPRPALIIQSDLFNPTHGSVVICPITSACIDASLFRITLEPNKQNGIKKLSQIMIDKMSAIQKTKIREKIGSLAKSETELINHAIRLWLNL
ncbi:type II toxin-antitoxin system PemK/MazF family toxin [Coxiella endosymbiont of Ornithodoros maritimus]|uniref:type II toxin-antitoxin system PemK/MazF family toxin n=1 Tax=Coxiella endosymbiont of Ornithodoros maritimus TaxID=1656172 RepID=UPI0022643974|nr:type II toxin-antitoxin system PemK/MazF family toxin [Coxiella endosymbiont of Ornithodoros maritimus]